MFKTKTGDPYAIFTNMKMFFNDEEMALLRVHRSRRKVNLQGPTAQGGFLVEG